MEDLREQRGIVLAATKQIRRYGDCWLVRSKADVAMVNETLCKVLCHNLVVLIHEMYELGIDPVFWNCVA
jgi:hypothetical protein